MEALILLVGEFLLAPLIGGIVAMALLIGLFLSLILELIFGIRIHSDSDKPKKKRTLSPKVRKWIRRLTIGSLVFFSTALLLINYVFFEPILRMIADKVETKTGIAIEYNAVEGSIFSSELTIQDLKLEQSKPGSAQFHIEAALLEVDLPVFRLICGQRAVDSLALTKASIQYEIPKAPKTEESKSVFRLEAEIVIKKNELEGVRLSTGSKPLEIPKYTIDHLLLEQVSVHVIDGSRQTPTSYDIAIRHFEVAPMRSHFAIFDLLFRSNLDATLNGSQLEIINTEKDGMRQTTWASNDVPAEVLASMIGGPFNLFDAGLVTVEVNDQWTVDKVDPLTLDWKIAIQNAHARIPESIPSPLSPLAQVWVNHINKNPKAWKFGFQLELSEARFQGASSLHAKEIWEDSIPVILKQIATYTGLEESIIEDAAGKTFDGLKRLLEDRK